MITKEDVENGTILELKCDICGAIFDDQDEMDEFMCFDYKMGSKSQLPDKEIKFDVCQDCFIEAFPEYFEADEDEPEEKHEGWKN